MAHSDGPADGGPGRAGPGLGADPGLIPDVAGPIRGYRVWRVAPGLDHQLYSFNADLPWPPGLSMVAECDRAEHRAPSPGCTCGVYALRRPHADWPKPSWFAWKPFIYVAGVVALWGRVVEHAEGWRAEEAYPMELWSAPGVDSCHHDRLAQIATRYGCPLRRNSAAWKRLTP